MGRSRQWPAIGLILLAGPAAAQERGSLASLIGDLYGGDGITLVNPFHRAHFEAQAQEELFDLNDDIARNVAFAPFNSSASRFAFDIAQGVPVRVAESLGPILTQRATTIGEGRINFGFSYTRIDYDRFDGDELDDLQIVLPHVDCCGPGSNPPGAPFDFLNGDGVIGPPGPTFELDQIVLDLDLDIEQQIFAAFATYGITERWDVGAVLPVVEVDASVRSVASLRDTTPADGAIHTFESDPAAEDFPVDSNSGSAVGIGDILLRSKYQFLDQEGYVPASALLAQLTLPTGEEDDLLGGGETGFLGLLAASEDFGRVVVHGNLGYEVFTGDVEDNLRWGVGTEVLLLDQLTGVAEVVGRYEPGGDGNGDMIDAVLGAKWNPAGDAVLSASLVLPVNRDTGLRADVIWGIAAELAF